MSLWCDCERDKMNFQFIPRIDRRLLSQREEWEELKKNTEMLSKKTNYGRTPEGKRMWNENETGKTGRVVSCTRAKEVGNDNTLDIQ